MTNDDRSNEDRTGDGQVPSWGDAPQQPAAGAAPADDAPRYGERVDPTPTAAPQYGEQAPQAETPRYGEQAPQAETPRYGEQAPQAETPRYGSTEYAEQRGQYGRPDDAQPQYGQQPYAAAPASAGSPSWQGYEEPKRKKKTVGVVAFVIALIALVLAVVAGVVFGSAFGGSSAIRDSLLDGSAATESGQQDLQQQLMNDPSLVTSSGGAGIAILVGTVLGLWAIVQGIIAIVTKRGRAFGVIALIVAVVAPIVLYIVFAVVLGTQLA